MYPFLFWAEYYDCIDQKTRKVSGCTFAPSYAEAMQKVEASYGDDLETCLLKCLGAYEGEEILVFATYEEADKIYDSEL